MSNTLPKSPSFRLDGLPVLVTGASSGLGQGCAVALAEMGAVVTLAARQPEALEQTAELMAEQGYQVKIQVMDVSDVVACQDAVAAQADTDLGPFRVVVNSAGLARHTPSVDTTPQDYDAVMDLNVRGAYFLMQAAGRALISAGQPGSLINISSQMGHVGGIDRAVYCASKHAVEGFTKAMAIEWGKHQVRINSICPTFIRTPLTASTFEQPDKVDWIKSKIHLGRVGEVEDIMGAVQYLASPASALVTGTSLLVDGGWTAE